MYFRCRTKPRTAVLDRWPFHYMLNILIVLTSTTEIQILVLPQIVLEAPPLRNAKLQTTRVLRAPRTALVPSVPGARAVPRMRGSVELRTQKLLAGTFPVCWKYPQYQPMAAV